MLARLGRTSGNFIHSPRNVAAFTITGNGEEFLYQRLGKIKIIIFVGEGDIFTIPC